MRKGDTEAKKRLNPGGFVELLPRRHVEASSSCPNAARN